MLRALPSNGLFKESPLSNGFIRHNIVSIRGSSELTRVEAGSNTSTVTLRVVGGDEKGSLESETVKYARESHGTRTRK
jgi:hypothetical protein